MTLTTQPSSPATPRATIWQKFADLLIAPHRSITDVGRQKRARLTAGLIVVIALAATAGALAGQGANLPYLLVLLAMSLVAYLFSRTKFFEFGSFIFLLALSAIPFITILINADGILAPRIYIWIPLALVIASALINRWALFLFTGLVCGAIVALNLLYPEQGNMIGQVSGTIATLGLLLIYLENFRLGAEKIRLEEIRRANRELSQISQFLEERVSERTAQLDRKSSQLEAAVLVARSAAENTNIKVLLNNVAEQISSRFGFYHTGIFLSDASRKKVYLAAASSEGGQRMLERGHSLDIGRQGVVGYAAYEKRARVAQDIEHENLYLSNVDLPATRSEVALPLLINNQVIGVLDIQSSEQSPFTTDDLFILQAMADQVALALQNARLLEESQAALAQLQVITSKTVQDAWHGYLGNRVKGYVYSAGDVAALDESYNPGNETEKRKMQIKIGLRGQTIGTISLARASNETDWTEKEQEFTEKIASQIALAIENARLLEDSQNRASREQTLNELTTRLSRSLDLENLLQNAVLELHKLPQVTDASVVIAPQEIRKQG
ncbi:MAG: GAF domain-containing protein [Anaerolineales bacterium]|jgi:GAF domain-containing protein|nr:GAF domain-containing protein [Anaerolineales bacterium]